MSTHGREGRKEERREGGKNEGWEGRKKGEREGMKQVEGRTTRVKGDLVSRDFHQVLVPPQFMARK